MAFALRVIRMFFTLSTPAAARERRRLAALLRFIVLPSYFCLCLAQGEPNHAGCTMFR